MADGLKDSVNIEQLVAPNISAFILDPQQVRSIHFSTVQHPYRTPPMISLSAAMDLAKSGDVLPSSPMDIAPYEDQLDVADGLNADTSILMILL